MRVVSQLSRFLLLTFAVCLLSGCDRAKAPEKPKKPTRFHAKTQVMQRFSVTIWNKNETTALGSNVFGLEFLTRDKSSLADPGPISVQPFMVDKTREAVPGTAVVKATDTPGVYDVFAELPSEGRWKFAVIAEGQTVFFYYTVRKPDPSGSKR